MIRFDHVSKKYPGTTRPALDDITLEVLRGEFVFLVGASGSGKSSCLRLILKEEKPTGGSMHVLGQDLGSISNRKVPYFRRNIGVVFQDFRLLPNKTVFQNVAFTLQVIGKSRGFIQEAVPDVLNMVGLAGKEQRLPHELSGGEQQRVAIARAVVNKPQVLLADEPTGNLDPVTSAGIMAVLERINAGGTTVVMATHEAGIVDQMQRRVVELVNGEIVRDERHGGYTTAIPVQRPTDAVPAAERAIAASETLASAAVAQAAPIVAEPAARPAAPNEAAVSAPELAPAPVHAVAPPEHERAPEPAPEADAAPEPAPEAEPAASRSREQEQEQELAYVMESAETSVAVAAATGSVPSVPPAAQNAHFAGAPTHPVLPQHPLTEDDLSEQLSLAEKLGLRAANSDRDDDEQNVGPVR